MSEEIPFIVETGSPLEQYERLMFTTIMLSVARTLRGDNLSLAQVATLHLLSLKESQRVGEIAEALDMQLPGASKLVGDLVERGFCSRHDDPGDRRVKIIRLTPAGADLVDLLSKRRAAEASFAIAGGSGEVSDSFNRLFMTMYEGGFTKAPKKP